MSGDGANWRGHDPTWRKGHRPPDQPLCVTGGFTEAVTRTLGPPTGCTQGATSSGISQAAPTSTERPDWPPDPETWRLDSVEWLL